MHVQDNTLRRGDVASVENEVLQPRQRCQSLAETRVNDHSLHIQRSEILIQPKGGAERREDSVAHGVASWPKGVLIQRCCNRGVELICHARTAKTSGVPANLSRRTATRWRRWAAALASGGKNPACKPDFDEEDVEVGNGRVHGDFLPFILFFGEELQAQIQPGDAIKRLGA
ncbi:hypothetical protein B0H13DRAFT_1878335 [Mycena leptocephala]|nr:hypothetical protein B0H13DRAFT_1878335 [Mycena leptocephala]